MEAFALQTLSSTAVSTLLVGALAFIFRSWISERLKSAIKNEYDEKLETHKAKLKGQSDLAIESLKSQLAITANEHAVRYARLYGKRADTIAEAYSLLTQVQWNLHMAVSTVDYGDTSKAEKYNVAHRAMADYRRFFEKNRIHLPEETCNLFDEMFRAMQASSAPFSVYAFIEEERLPTEALEKKYAAWEEASKFFDEEVPKLRKSLEGELRKILGPY
jgi:hypothetical protein